VLVVAVAAAAVVVVVLHGGGGRFGGGGALTTLFCLARTVTQSFTMSPVLIRIERGGALAVFTTHPAVCFRSKNNKCVVGGPHDMRHLTSCHATPPPTPAGAKDTVSHVDAGIELHVEGSMAPRTASFLSFLARAIDAAGPARADTYDGLALLIALGDGIEMDTQRPNIHVINGERLSPVLTFNKAEFDTRAVAVPDPYFIDSQG
jgi:hypothetical protein